MKRYKVTASSPGKDPITYRGVPSMSPENAAIDVAKRYAKLKRVDARIVRTKVVEEES